MILICYDGSEDSKAAIERAGALFKSAPATVLSVWQPLMQVLERTPLALGVAPGMIDFDDADTASRDHAAALAEEGAKLAGEHGLDAKGGSCSQTGTTADAILTQAENVGASAIVMGSRGLTGFKSLLLGSVSHAVLQHADRSVIVVPSPTVADSRRKARHALHTSH